MTTDSNVTEQTGGTECDHIVGLSYDAWGGDLLYQSDSEKTARELDRTYFLFCPTCGQALMPK